MRSGAIDRNDFRSGFSLYGIGSEPFAVGYIVDLNLLILTNAGQPEQIGIDRAGTFILKA